MTKKSILLLCCSFLLFTGCQKISIEKNKIVQKHYQIFPVLIQEQPIGNITISKISLDAPLYNQNSEHNNVEENVTLLESNPSNSHFIIAAHSGTGPIAYFKRLEELTIDDEIFLDYNNEIFHYNVIEKYYEIKNGIIHLPAQIKDTLILTTCANKKNQQLILIAKKKT